MVRRWLQLELRVCYLQRQKTFSHGLSPFPSPIAAEFWSCEKEKMAAAKHWGWMDLWAAFHLPIPWDSEPWVEGRVGKSFGTGSLWRFQEAEETAANSQWTIARKWVSSVYGECPHTFCKLMWVFSAANTCWKLWPSLPGATILHGWLYLWSGAQAAQGLSKNLGTRTNDLSSFSKCHFGASPISGQANIITGNSNRVSYGCRSGFPGLVCNLWHLRHES